MGVAQQFEFGKRTIAKGMVPILEPEVDITAKDKAAIEDLLLPELVAGLKTLGPDDKVIFKLSLPEKANLYKPLMSDPHVVRVVALSCGYDLAESNKRLAANNGMIASLSRMKGSQRRWALPSMRSTKPLLLKDGLLKVD